ncbi:hypothetical protein PRNP1_004859 [Phytophthora ramorum]
MEQLLRPRANTVSVPAEDTETPEAALLPRHGGAPASHTPSSGRSWLPRLLLLGGAVYAVLMLAWTSQNLSVLQTGSDSAASKSNMAVLGVESASKDREGEQDEPMDLASILKAANHPQTDAEREFARSHVHEKLTVQQDQEAEGEEDQKTKEREEEITHVAIPVLTQAAIDIPMEASQVREALRLARDAVVARMEEEGSTSSEPAASESQLADEEKRRQEAEEQARDVLLLPKNETQPRNLKCLGWRSTGGCSPFGPRKPENDFTCMKLVPFGHSGYCEVEDMDTGERFRVMRRYCSSSKWDTSFRCSDAANFVNFHYKARDAADEALAPGFALPNVDAKGSGEQDPERRDGIVMVVYPKLIPSAYATIKTLRDGEVLFLHRNSHKLTGEPLREQVDYRSRAIARSRKKAEIRQRYRAEGKEIPPWSELDGLVQAEETPAPTLEPAEPDGYPDSAVWTHLLSFNKASRQENYYIETFNADPEFPKSQNCYGQRNVSKNEHFYAQEVADLPFAGLETDLRRFAAEAVEIKQAQS